MLRYFLLVLAVSTGIAARGAITDPVDKALFSPTFIEDLDRYVAESENRAEEIGRQAKEGDRLAQGRWCALGVLRASRKGVDVDDAIATCRRLAESRVPLGMYLYGRALLEGRKVKRDAPEGIRLINAAANTGHSCSMHGLAVAYQYGNGVPQDYKEMHKWLYRSAASGCPGAQLLMGVALVNGIGVEKNFAEAHRWYLMAAKAGSGMAMNNLGNAYLSGRGVPKDEKIAAEWYLKGAKAGNPIAMGNVGAMYEEGRGVTQDAAEAFRWYVAGALDADANSMYRLAQAFHYGRGVEKNWDTATMWYVMAAARDEKIKVKVEKMIEELTAQSQAAAGEGKKLDQGEVTGSLYTNAYFGMRMKISEGWQAVGPDVRQRLAESGARATGRTGAEAKADAREVSDAILLTVAKHRSGRAKADGVLAIVAERVGPNVTSLDYLTQVRALNRKNPNVVEAGEITPVSIAGRAASTYTAKLEKENAIVTTKQLVWIDKGYALAFILSYAEDNERREMESMLNAIEFK